MANYGSFKPTTVSTLPAIIEPLSDAAKFWKNNVQPATVYRELKSINSIDSNCFREILATSSSKISLFDLSTSDKKRTFLSPNHTQLYCGTFRQENPKIFATGAADGIVRIWESKKSKPLRLLGSPSSNPQQQTSPWHTGPVHRVNFNGLRQLFSCGDDKEVKLWDFTEGNIITRFGGETSAHDDYIRASCLQTNTGSFVSGSYDHTVKVWDHRSPEKSSFRYSHKHPVESVTHRDLLIISAAGTTVQIFDVVAGKILRTLDNVHHKTITCIYNHGSYLLTASIDGHLKIYDINFNVITSFCYTPSQLLSCHYDGSFLAVGTNDGILSINKITQKNSGKAESSSASIDNEEQFADIFFNNLPSKRKRERFDLSEAIIVPRTDHRPSGQEPHEKLLRGFRHTAALNRVFRDYHGKNPEKIVNFMQELIRRNALRAALAGRTAMDLKKIIKFLTKNISDFRFSRILLDVSLILLEVYTVQIRVSSKIRNLFKELKQCMDNEIACLEKMSQLSGQLQFLINSQIK